MVQALVYAMILLRQLATLCLLVATTGIQGDSAQESFQEVIDKLLNLVALLMPMAKKLTISMTPTVLPGLELVMKK